MATHCGFNYEQSSCPKKLNRRCGRADMTGELFEVVVAALMFIRAVFETDEFQLATNVDGLRDFDDLFLKYTDKKTKKQHACFLQLKYKEKKSVTYRSLIARNGDFSLMKYYDSWCEVHNMLNSSDNFLNVTSSNTREFILYTNADLNFRDGKIDKELCEETFLFSSSSGGNAYKLKLKMYEEIESYRRSLLKISSGEVNQEDILEELQKYNELKFCQRLLKLIDSPDEFGKLLEHHISYICKTETWEEFLSQLRIYPSQASVQQLEDLIKQELFTYFGTNEKKMEELYSKLKEGTMKWWRDGSTYLSDNYAPFWNVMLREYFVDLTNPMFEKLEEFLELQFKTTLDIPKTGQVVHIKSQSNIHLSCLKVHNWLQDSGFVMLDSNILNARLAEVMAFWKYNDWCNVLVLVDCVSVSDIILDISALLTTNTNKLLVLISNGTVPLEDLFDDRFQVHSCMDHFCLSELDEESQKLILKKEINFQGYSIKLESLIKDPNSVTGDVIDAFVSGHEVNVGCELNNLNEFYIPRKLLRKECVNENFMFTKSKECFAISGLSLTEMEKLLKSMDEIESPTGESPYSCKFVIINNKADFHKVCENNERVHWIHKTENKFVWKSSKGDVKLIKKCLKSDSNHMLYDSGKDLLNIPQQIVLIIDEPGMGKTTELSHIAKELKEEDPTTWIIQINLNDYTEDLKQGTIDIMELLMKASNLNTAFERSLFEHEIKHGGNIIIMFDSFDEVCPNYTEKVLTILNELSFFKFKKIFVTSRPGLRDKLEQELTTLSFVLKPFSKEDKLKFLNALCTKNSTDSSSQLHKFIHDLLEMTSNSINDDTHTFPNTPLETMMLFEVFEAQALYNTTTGEISMLQNLDILKLYELFLDRKHAIFLEKYGLDTSNLGLSEYYQGLYKMFLKNHMICSLVVFLDKNAFNKLHNSERIWNKYLELLEKLKDAKERTGILTEVINDKPVFIHRTFAEYFVGLWLSKNFEFNRSLIKQLFFNSGFETVRMFFDRILARHSRLHTAVLNLDKNVVHILLSTSQVDVNGKDEGGRTALHVSIMKYNDKKLQSDKKYRRVNFQIISMLLEYGADPNIEDDVFCWKPLRLAVELEVWNVIGLLLTKTNHVDDMKNVEEIIVNNDILFMILWEAAEGGYVQLVEYITKHVEHVIDHKLPTGTGICTMLHIAATHGHLNLVQYLVDQGADIEIMDSFHERTPLMCAVQEGHFEIVEFLIGRGACVNVIDRHGNNELMLATIAGNCHMIKKFLSLGLNIHFRNKRTETPLLTAIKHNKSEAMTLLFQFGADINTTDEKGNTPLHYAAIFGAHKCLTSLLQNQFEDVSSLNVDISNNILETPLMVAVRNIMWHAAELLLKHGANINICDIDGNSVIHYAAKYGDIKFVKNLLQFDSNNEVSNIEIEPFAVTAAKYGNWEILKQLSELSNSINFIDKDGTSVLHYAVDTGVEYITSLVNSGYDINCKDRRNETPLLRAAKKKKWNVVNLLLKLGADTKASDIDGNNMLFHVCEAGEVGYAKSMIDLGVDVNSRNMKDETPLLAAMRQKHINVCRLLQEHGADMTVFGVDGNNVIHHLVNFENAGFLNDIISQDVNIDADYEFLNKLINLGLSINSINSKNESPTLIAARNGRWDIVNLLIEHGAELSQCDDKGNYILHHMITFGNVSIMNCLEKLDLNIKNKAQETPILRAAKLRKWDMVKKLLMHGADGSERDGDGNGILHHAADDIQIENNCMVELLDLDLDVNMKNNDLQTPILKAAIRGKWDIVNLFSFYGADVKSVDTYGNTIMKYAIENNSISFVAELFDSEITSGAIKH